MRTTTENCKDRKGGAIVKIAYGGETLIFWTTNGAFIDEAIKRLNSEKEGVILFKKLIDGKDCDSWTWHPDPAHISFVDQSIELCDGLPSHIENDKDYRFKEVGEYCPWRAKVLEVQDRR